MVHTTLHFVYKWSVVHLSFKKFFLCQKRVWTRQTQLFIIAFIVAIDTIQFFFIFNLNIYKLYKASVQQISAKAVFIPKIYHHLEQKRTN